MLQRVKINLKPLNNTILDYNYSYILSCEIYNKIKLTDVEFAKKYHKEGIRKSSDDKNFKMLNPILFFEDVDLCKEGIIINKTNKVTLNIGGSSDVILKIINGFMKDDELKIKNTLFKFIGFEYENLNKLKNNILYKCLTPVVTSIQENNKIKYIELSDERYIQLIKNNLLNKYKMLYNKNYSNELEIKILDTDNAKRKLVKIKDNICVIGYKKFNIIISGDKDIQEVAYCCGIGINNMMGMGNLQIIRGENIG